MKFLSYRDDFLNQKSVIKTQIEDSKLINEMFQNDIRFGDSYFGRLVNSSWQSLIRGKQGLIDIPGLLQDLENNLIAMVDRITMEQIVKEYPTLLLKSILEEIKACCMSTLSDDEKLEVLIGWDGSTQMFDPDHPIEDIPGIYVNRRLLTNSLVQNCYDRIEDPSNKEKLENALGEKAIKAYLDTMSDFMDKLREMTIPSGKAKPSVSPTPAPFNLNLLNVLQKIVATNLGESLKLRFLKYGDFINENENLQSDNLKTIKKLAEELIAKLKENSEEDITKTDTYQNFINTLKGLSENEIEVLNAKNLTNELESAINVQLDNKSNQQKAEKEEIQKSVEKPTEKTPTNVGSQIPSKPTTDNIQKPQVVTQQPQKQEVETKAVTNQTNPQKVEEKPADNQPQKPEVLDASNTKVNQQSTTEKQDDEETKQPESKEEKVESTTEGIRSSKYLDYIKLILEEQAGLPGAPTNPGGSTPPTAPTPPTQPNASTPKKVNELWEEFFKEVDQILPAKMTQDDINKIKNFNPTDVDYALSITRRPNPLIKIVRICEKANAVYTSITIPSGRTNGEVGNKTFRKYQYVGTGTPGSPAQPGNGPWVYLPLYNSWKDGVLVLMGKPQFGEIFKDIDKLFESMSNKTKNLILEQETKTSNEKKKPAEILKEFFVEMLKLDNQGKFTQIASSALAKFFGINIDSDKLKGDKKGSVSSAPIDKEDIKEDSFVWEDFKQTSFLNEDVDQFFAFPIEDLRKTKGPNTYNIIFVRPLKIDGDKVEIKFTTDHQAEMDEFMNQSSYGSSTKANWSCGARRITKHVYYGVMKNDFTNGLQITYGDVGNSKADSTIDPLMGEPSTPSGVLFKFSAKKINLDRGDKISLHNARLVYYDKNKAKQKIKKDDLKVNNEILSDGFKDLDTKSGDKLYNALEKLGTKPEFGYWK